MFVAQPFFLVSYGKVMERERGREKPRNSPRIACLDRNKRGKLRIEAIQDSPVFIQFYYCYYYWGENSVGRKRERERGTKD